MSKFNNRVFGCAIIKAINSNYNADFSHQPRTLPSGVVYATDKALKYSIRNFWKNALDEKVFYSKSLTDEMSPRTLDETYEKFFGKDSLGEKDKKKLRFSVLTNLLSVVDIRIFGGTYAGKTNISLHGTCQITHGINRFPKNEIYSEQIMSPFRNPSDKNADSTMTTLGTQSKLSEGHYVHHFSVNPKNIADDAKRVGSDGLTQDDIAKLKEGLRKGVTYYDSSAKSGSENEVLFWVQLKEDSKAVLPSFVELIQINGTGLDREIDFSSIKTLLAKENIASEIEKIEVYYQKGITKVVNLPANSQELDI
jgi:CRISPR-associated protein Csh2